MTIQAVKAANLVVELKTWIQLSTKIEKVF